jgi:hypothetical protein
LSRANFANLLRFLRRLFTGAVILYVIVLLAFGGTAPAKAVFHGAVVLWSVLLIPCWHRTGFPWLEISAGNLALTMVLAEGTLRLYAAFAGTSPFLQETLDAYRLTPGKDYGDGLRGNRLGYPGRDFDSEKSPGTFRIAALGDSFALGPAVPFADNYLSLLEQALPGTEVYNFGVSGTGPRDYLAILRRDVWRFQPDLVLVSVFVGNDITEILSTPRHMDPRQHCLYLLVTRAWRLLRERDRSISSDAVGGERLKPGLSEDTFREIEARRLSICLNPSSAQMEKKWQQASRDLDELIKDCRDHGAPVAFVLIPDEFQVNPEVLRQAMEDRGVCSADLDLDGPQRRLSAFSEQRGIPCLDLLSSFQLVPDAYAPRDTHWNVRGNRLAASQIAPWLHAQINSPDVSLRPLPAP